MTLHSLESRLNLEISRMKNQNKRRFKSFEKHNYMTFYYRERYPIRIVQNQNLEIFALTSWALILPMLNTRTTPLASTITVVGKALTP